MLGGTNKNKSIRVIKENYLRGPNIHGLFPVMEAHIDIGRWVQTSSEPGFSEKVSSLLEWLSSNGCYSHESGVLIDRFKQGMLPVNIIEHCVLVIQNTLGSSVTFSKSDHVEGSIYRLVTGFDVEQVASRALEFSVDIVNSLLEEGSPCEDRCERFSSILAEMKKSHLIAERLGPSTNAIIEAAKERDIPYKKMLPKYSLFSLGWGVKKKEIWGPVTSQTSSIGSDIVDDKNLCKTILKKYGLNVPKGKIVRSLQDVLTVAESIGYPVVLKPSSGNHGKGVIVDLRDEDEVKDVFDIVKQRSDDVMVERYIRGTDYRFLVIDHKVKAVAKRKPAHVVGDGESSIRKLVELSNEDPRRGEGHISTLTKLKLGEEEMSHLQRCRKRPDDVPGEGEIVYLRGVANLSTGGTAENCTEKVHPSFKVQVERASRVLGMDLVGIDLVAEDISIPQDQTDWAIIEANSSPGLRMHISPNEGGSIPVGKHVIEHLFHEGDGRIPIIAVTGTNGKTTTCRLIEWIIRDDGYHTGMAVTDGIYLGDDKIADGDTTGPWSAQAVLQDKSVEFAVLETARGGILKKGLGFDRCSVSVVTNIKEDHIGVDNIRNIEDIFTIKSVLVEATEEDGHCVINANDNFAERLMKKGRGKPVLFSIEPNELTDEHIDQGGLAFVHEDNYLFMYDDCSRTKIMGIDEAPFLMGGVSMLLENSLAAIAASYCVGISLESIKGSLSNYENTEATNPGRLNMYEYEGRKILVDYAHNPSALDALGEYVDASGSKHKTIVFAGVGDRRDKDLIDSGARISMWFDDIVITEYPRLMRGREYGEISKLIMKGVNSNPKEPVIINDMHLAVRRAVEESQKDELIALVDLDYTYEMLIETLSKINN